MKTTNGSEDRPPTSEESLTIIYSPDDVPEFALGTAYLGSDELYDEAAKQPRSPLLRPTSLRLDRRTTDRLRTLAKRKGMDYRTLLKQFLLERLTKKKNARASSSAFTKTLLGRPARAGTVALWHNAVLS